MPLFGLLPGGLPGPGPVSGGVHLGSAGVGEVVGLAPVFLERLDQALVFELGQRRIHRARTRPPRAAGALVQGLDDLVPVHRLLGDQEQRRGAHVTALHPAPAAAPLAAALAAEHPPGAKGPTWAERTTLAERTVRTERAP